MHHKIMTMTMSCYEGGFRLNDAASVCSMRSKARIDSLFEDSKSVCSSICSDYYNNPFRQCNMGDVNCDEQKRANKVVQARIEAMFASIEAESGSKGECPAAVLPVKYLGAAPVGGRIASVRGLQEPLRQLLTCIDNSLSAELEISRRGLTFRTCELVEKVTPFRRIAVWSALRLRSKISSEGSDKFHYAFIPLIGLEDTRSENDEKHTYLFRAMQGLSPDTNSYPPIFAIVMRRPGAARVLECHAFACKTDEDTVAAAATLYRALLADLESNRRRPRQSNGIGCVSLASVASSVVDNENISVKSVPHPVRPPRVKKHSSRSTTDDNVSLASNIKIMKKKSFSKVRLEKDQIAQKVRQNQATEAIQQGVKVIEPKKILNSNDLPDENVRNVLYSNTEIRGRGSISNSEKLRMSLNDLNYSFIEKKGNSIVGEIVVNSAADSHQLYEKNYPLYDLNKNVQKNHYSNQPERVIIINQENYLQNDKNECNLRCNESLIKNKNSDKGRNKYKSYEDYHDENTIYSLNQDDEIYHQKRRSNVINNSNNAIQSFNHNNSRTNSRNSNNNRNNSNNNNNNNSVKRNNDVNESMKKKENSKAAENIQRISRIEEFSRVQNCSSITSNSSCEKILKTKRNRAGSEPPLSRTENIATTSQDVKLKRSLSDIEVERGDLMTRVELPRRGSFLKASSARLPNNINGGTPLGFTELFDEFRNQEGLTSVDDILDAIIDPEGMSFNELKPLYKEFLLKLASTLTQDELYQRSANIMRRRRRPQRMRSNRKSSLLGRAIKRSVSKLKSGPTEFTSVIFPAKKFTENMDSSSSCDMRNNKNRVLASRLNRRRSSYKRSKGLALSEDSDTCKRIVQSIGANRSSSGYVSCSECSYDSESCTCISADKCYCSLPRKTVEQVTASGNNIIVCNCDTDSCSESNKCYCARRPAPLQSTILEQLRQRGIIPSEGSISTESSPDRIRDIKHTNSHSSSQSLEFYKIRPSPVRSYDNLALDYDLFNPGKKSMEKGEKILVVSARNPDGRLVYVGGTKRNKKSMYNARPAAAHHEALSIKKSAEIAAVFGSSTCKRTGSISSMRSSVSLEAGLGYLP